LLETGRPPECWIPPAHLLECRALLQTYQDLRVEHTAWVQRIHAVCFHQGCEALVHGGVSTQQGRARLQQITGQLSPAGQIQVAVAARVLDALEIELDALRARLVEAAKHLRGATVLRQRVYGVGPIGGLAFTCWLAGADRFSSAGKAVRFCGLDVTVYSSAGKRAPGRLSRQGPPILRWVAYEAGMTHARAGAPTTPTTRRSPTASTASVPRWPRPARSCASSATSWPTSARTHSAGRDLSGRSPSVAHAMPGRAPRHQMGSINRGQLPPAPCQTAARPVQDHPADGL